MQDSRNSDARAEQMDHFPGRGKMIQPRNSPARAEQLTLIWESELVPRGGGRMELVARRALSHMSVRQAGRVLGVSAWTVRDLFRLGLICGYKPGARVQRKDGQPSNASLRLDSESVLRYKAEREAMSREA